MLAIVGSGNSNVVGTVEIQFDGEFLYRIGFLQGQVSSLSHLGKHHIAALFGHVFSPDRVVKR
ncbi:hypothetical protein SDC9_82789 [bioreactor metagenome]|uniref:Uncharacterized protein n=1 Tax=bioreactor metagenome TaxID=1076179 RepID=A0A644ZE83_9ZZZZ